MPRKRFKDRAVGEGQAKIAKFIPGEPASARHARRLNVNVSQQNEVRRWAKANSLSLTISNHGHHWSFYPFNAKRGEPQLFEWWPSSAKMVIKKRWRHGIHVHDIYQLMTTAEKRLAKDLQELREAKDLQELQGQQEAKELREITEKSDVKS